LVRTAVSHVFVRALSQQDRTLALRLLLAAMEGYGAAVLREGLDLLEYLIGSGGCTDGKRAPRSCCSQAAHARSRDGWRGKRLRAAA
jgi:hypothetical protein